MYVVNSTRSYERGRERDRGIVEEYTTTHTIRKREILERERRGIPTSQYIIYPCGLLLPHGRQERERENHNKFPQLHSTS